MFDVVSQLNRGAALITDRARRRRLGQLNFLAGRKAKAAIAYASARDHLAAASALADSDPDDAWQTDYDDRFALCLERAECEYLVGAFDAADQLFAPPWPGPARAPTTPACIACARCCTRCRAATPTRSTPPWRGWRCWACAAPTATPSWRRPSPPRSGTCRST